MKKLSLMLIAVVALSGAAYAAEVKGTIASVNATASKLEVATENGASWVEYSAATTWPEGITDPASLKDKQVTITTDEAGKATAVSSEAAAEAPAA